MRRSVPLLDLSAKHEAGLPSWLACNKDRKQRETGSLALPNSNKIITPLKPNKHRTIFDFQPLPGSYCASPRKSSTFKQTITLCYALFPMLHLNLPFSFFLLGKFTCYSIPKGRSKPLRTTDWSESIVIA